MADIGYITISKEEYTELYLKAWKYDRLREKSMKNNCFSNAYIPTEIDIYEATSEEIEKIKEAKKQQKMERELDEAF